MIFTEVSSVKGKRGAAVSPTFAAIGGRCDHEPPRLKRNR
jgi:hypothetical protein